MTKNELKLKYTGSDGFLQGFDYFVMDEMEFFFGVYEEEPKRSVFIINSLQEEIRDNHEPY